MDENTDANDGLLTPQEAADFLGICTYTLRELRRGGRVPSYRVGTRLVRYRRDELLASLPSATLPSQDDGAKTAEAAPFLAEAERDQCIDGLCALVRQKAYDTMPFRGTPSQLRSLSRGVLRDVERELRRSADGRRFIAKG